MPAIDDVEGSDVEESIPRARYKRGFVDAHVHLFPDRLFDAVWRWFDRHGWPIRYRLHTPEVLRFLFARGVDHVVALHYAHKPGIARSMNRFMADIARAEPRVTALATVMPGEPQAREILEEGFALGLSGVKLHSHVQGVAVDAAELEVVYETCLRHDKPVVFHAGREPSSSGYKGDPRLLCGVDRTAAVLRAYPKLRLCVPHLGADEITAYGRLLERHDNLWLDTTMVLAGYFSDDPESFRLVEARPDRVMYGTDFPNLPYAWDRELRRLAQRGLSDDTCARILGGTARAFFAIE